jgi:short-subunit dehydrogenase
MAGRRIVIPGLVNKALVWSARMTPRAVLLPVLATAQQKKRP